MEACSYRITVASSASRLPPGVITVYTTGPLQAEATELVRLQASYATSSVLPIPMGRYILELRVEGSVRSTLAVSSNATVVLGDVDDLLAEFLAPRYMLWRIVL